jgi:hypothetical protein
VGGWAKFAYEQKSRGRGEKGEDGAGLGLHGGWEINSSARWVCQAPAVFVDHCC